MSGGAGTDVCMVVTPVTSSTVVTVTTSCLVAAGTMSYRGTGVDRIDGGDGIDTVVLDKVSTPQAKPVSVMRWSRSIWPVVAVLGDARTRL